MRFVASFADRIIASVESVRISSIYTGLIEGSLSSVTKGLFLPAIKARRDLIKAGELLGVYCFKPELISEKEFLGLDNRIFGKCLKDNLVKAKLNVFEGDGRYSIVLEWYLSTRELTGTLLPELVQQAAGKLKFRDIKKYCKFDDWGDLA